MAQKSEQGKKMQSSNSARLPAAVAKKPDEPGKIKVTPENASLIMVQLLSEIRNLQARILKYFEEAASGSK